MTDAFVWDLPPRFNFTADVVERIAREDDHAALIWTDADGHEETYRFSDIARPSARFGAALRAAGVGEGDRIVVMLPRLPHWQVALCGAIRVGAVPIPCIDMLTARDVAYRVEHGEAVAAVTTAGNAGKFDSVAGRLRLRVSVGAAAGWTEWEAALAADAPGEPAEMALDDPAIMYFTSGSAGHPKGVLHGARALFAWRVSAQYWLDLHRDDVMWCTADTGWSKAGTSILFGPWSRGATVLFHDGPFDPVRRLELLSRHRVTIYCAAATELRRVVRQDLAPYDLSALRLAVSAGESVDAALVREWEARTGIPLRESYGQTETLMTVGYQPGMAFRPGSMGKPLPGSEVALLEEDGRRVPQGAVGMLTVRLPFPQFMLGYWKAPEMTEAALLRNEEGTWFRTGDLATADAGFYLYYAGRADDVINSAGYRIGPMEVESAVLEHPAVQECAVVAEPDAERGEIVCAFVMLRPGWEAGEETARSIQEHVRTTTAPYKYPRRVRFIRELPKTATGKISRRILRGMVRAAG